MIQTSRSEAKHTQGPLKLCFHFQSKEKDESCPCGFPGDIWGADGEHVVCTMGPITAGTDGMHPPRYPREVELANAARIVACWNAMIGIEDPAALRAERDELIAALNSARGWVATYAMQTYSASASRELESIDALLAKSQGGRDGG